MTPCQLRCLEKRSCCSRAVAHATRTSNPTPPQPGAQRGGTPLRRAGAHSGDGRVSRARNAHVGRALHIGGRHAPAALGNRGQADSGDARGRTGDRTTRVDARAMERRARHTYQRRQMVSAGRWCARNDAWTSGRAGRATGGGPRARRSRSRLRNQTAETCSSSATRNEEPQPQAATTFGFSTLKPAPWRVSW
jgi:hypothetical protein